MTPTLIHYLENIRENLRLNPSEESEVISELETHIEDKLQELKEAGLSEEEATETCLGLLGSAKVIACQMYEAHSQGTWKQAILASTPHLVFGLMFALNLWNHIGWLSIVLSLVCVTAAYGWWHGKPSWVFPWLGYSLLPVAVAGLLLLYIPEGWSWVAILLYIPLAIWWLYYVVVQTIKKDWLLGSVMLLPLPIIVGWFLAVAPDGKISEYTIQRVYIFAPWIGISFLAFALTMIAFIRMRQRWLRIVLLIVSGFLTLTIVAHYTSDRLSLPAFLILILAMWGLFLIPAILERFVKTSERRFKRNTNIHPSTVYINSDAREVSDAKSSYRH